MNTSYEPLETLTSETITPHAEFLTPQQRLDGATDILAAITVRILKKRYENIDASTS